MSSPHFPTHFLWGSATSSHQVEGGNTHNDWWAWEQTRSEGLRSVVACDHWNRWREDIDLLKSLGQNAYRLSLEWSRIEPTEGAFDQEALTHYKEVLQYCRAQNITTVVTLHHFTNPLWIRDQGGWTSTKTIKDFCRYAETVLSFLGTEIDLLITINEPQVYSFMSYTIGAWPPNVKSEAASARVMWNMSRAHRAVYQISKRLLPHLPVGIAYNMTTFEAHNGTWRERFFAKWFDLFNNRSFFWLTGMRTHDFFGLNYYFHRRLDGSRSFIPSFVDPKQIGKDTSDLGWELYPSGIGKLARSLACHEKPILITEHGLADAEDTRRPSYLKESLKSLLEAKRDGAPVIGYLHWSLLDNFEWADGFEPRFGLVEVDFKTQERTPRGSALVYKEFIEEQTP